MKNYAAAEVIEWFALLERVGSDEDYIKDMLNKWFSDHSATLTCILNAMQSENTDDILIYSHKLKGSAAVFGMSLISAAALRIELASDVKNKNLWPEMYENLKSEFEKARDFVARPDWFELTKNKVLCKMYKKKE